MNDHTDIPRRLKQLRELAGLSVREMARRVGMSSSGYSHYENPARFKETTLPMAQAKLIAEAVRGTPIHPNAIMELAGLPGSYAPPLTTIKPGMAEDATPFTLEACEVGPGETQPALRAIFGNAAATPATYQLGIDLPAFALVAGDVLLVDLSRLPEPGELALVTHLDEEHATSKTTINRYFPPYLQSGDLNPTRPPARVDQVGVTVRHPVIGSMRGITRI